MEKEGEKDEKIEKNASVRGLEQEWTPHSASWGIDKKLFTRKGGSVNIETLYDTVKNSPECVACQCAITEDIMADGWRFNGSKSAIEKAQIFEAKSKYFKVKTNAILELLTTGNAYILKLSVDENKLKSVIKKLQENIAKNLGVKFDEKSIYEFIDQEVKQPKDLQLLKSSTIRINYDETGQIASYEQSVNGKKRVYRAKDIIHLTLMNIGGQPYGFTPLEPMLSDIATLIFAKEFAGKYFENDGMPSWLFVMPEASAGDRNYEALKKEFKELKKQVNKYRSLIITGKVDPIQINKFNKDMEFAKLITHFTQIILMSYGVPAHRVNLTIDVKEVGGAVNRAYEGYYKKINFMQTSMENTLNAELWNAFNVVMKFRATYKIDEMREAQVVQILTQAGLITVEEAREMMGLEPEKPKGTEPRVTGDNMKIDFGKDKRQQSSDPSKENMQDNTDNKLKEILDILHKKM